MNQLMAADQLLTSVQSAPATPGKTADKAQARQLAEEFEAMFISQMVEHMYSGIKTDGPFGGGHAEKVFRSMINQEYSKLISARGDVGIADSVYREILKLQEQQ